MKKIIFFLLLVVLLSACGRETQNTDQGDMDFLRAQAATTNFFTLLNAGLYNQAAMYYGGDYLELQMMNPKIDKNDNATLLKNACTVNGYQCLKIKKMIGPEKLSEGKYKVRLQFALPDSSLYIKKSPDAASIEQNEFEFLIHKIDDQYKVMSLPVYNS